MKNEKIKKCIIENEKGGKRTKKESMTKHDFKNQLTSFPKKRSINIHVVYNILLVFFSTNNTIIAPSAKF